MVRRWSAGPSGGCYAFRLLHLLGRSVKASRLLVVFWCAFRRSGLLFRFDAAGRRWASSPGIRSAFCRSSSPGGGLSARAGCVLGSVRRSGRLFLLGRILPAFAAGAGSFPGSLLLLGCMWSDGAAAAAVAAAGLMMVQCCRRSGCRSDDGLMFPGCCMWSDDRGRASALPVAASLPGGRWSPSGGWISCRASWAAAPMGPRSLVPVPGFSGLPWVSSADFRRLPGFPGSLGPVPPTFGRFRAAGLPVVVFVGRFWPAGVGFCMVGGCRLPAAAFVAVGGLDPAAIYTYTRARRGSCRVVSRSDGEKPVQRYMRARRCCRWCAISNGGGRFGRRAISNGARSSRKRRAILDGSGLWEKNQILVLKNGGCRRGRVPGAGLLIGGAGGGRLGGPRAWSALVGLPVGSERSGDPGPVRVGSGRGACTFDWWAWWLPEVWWLAAAGPEQKIKRKGECENE